MDLTDDLDEQAFAKKPKPFGWFVAGGVTIAAIGFVLGGYLPLRGAHARLMEEHEKLAQKSQELDQALRDETKTLESTEGRRAALQAFVYQATQSEKEHRNRVESTKGALEKQFASQLKSKQLELQTDEQGVSLIIGDALMFRGATDKPSPHAGRVLCGAGKILGGQRDWILRVRTEAPAGDRDGWSSANKRAAALADLLEKGCKVPSSSIRTESVRGSDPKTTKTQLSLVPEKAIYFSPSDAPEDKTAKNDSEG